MPRVIILPASDGCGCGGHPGAGQIARQIAVAGAPAGPSVGARAARCWRAMALVAMVLGFVGAGARAKGAGEQPSPAPSEIDALVLKKLKADGLTLAPPCPDEVFVRRVFLDAIGTLPTPEEVRAFLADTRADKRERLIEALLERDEFADYWGLKWGDLLRVRAEVPCNLWPGAAQAYDQWIRLQFRANRPYDQFVRELLTASGSSVRNPPSNFYRNFEQLTPVKAEAVNAGAAAKNAEGVSRPSRSIANNVALVFLGLRLEASGLTPAQIDGFTAFFAKMGCKKTEEYKTEVVYFDPGGLGMRTADGNEVKPVPLDGSALDIPPGQDPRPALADWIVSPKNPWFGRAVVNRIWYWLLGRGIVHEPDDMRASNAPWSPELLACLEKELVAGRYDLKHIYRLILNSKTYQADSRVKSAGPTAAEEAGFARYRLRQLDAEVLLDAIDGLTGHKEYYFNATPAPASWFPGSRRSILLSDADITVPFLDLFGRPRRDGSLLSERKDAPSLFQSLYLLNSDDIYKQVATCSLVKQLAAAASPATNATAPAATADTKPAGGTSAAKPAPADTKLTADLRVGQETSKPAPDAAKMTVTDAVENLYLRVLSRPPTDHERSLALAYLGSPQRKPLDSAADLLWALLNTREFILKH